MEFFKSPEQYLDILKKNQTVSSEFASKYFDSFEKITKTSMGYYKTSLDSMSDLGAKCLDVKDPQDFSEISKTQLGVFQDEATGYCKSVFKVNSKLFKELSDSIESSTAEFNKFVSDSVSEFSKNAPAGSEGIVEITKSSIAASSSTYDAMTNAAKQVFELVESNVEAASKVSGAVDSQPAPKTSRSRKAA